MKDFQAGEQKPYTPPDTLDPPLNQIKESPTLPILIGFLASLTLGIGLFIASRFMYVYILFNVLLGLGIGRAMGFGIRRARYTKVSVLFGLTILYSLLCYVVFNYSLYCWILLKSDLSPPTFLQFLQIRAEHNIFIRGIKPGTIGNIIVWIVEVIITLWVAAKVEDTAIRTCHIESIPPTVMKFMIYLVSRGHDRNTIDRELEKRGWFRPEDRNQAFLAVSSAVALIQESKK